MHKHKHCYTLYHLPLIKDDDHYDDYNVHDDVDDGGADDNGKELRTNKNCNVRL